MAMSMNTYLEPFLPRMRGRFDHAKRYRSTRELVLMYALLESAITSGHPLSEHVFVADPLQPFACLICGGINPEKKPRSKAVVNYKTQLLGLKQELSEVISDIKCIK